jgi:hypothetical protein
MNAGQQQRSRNAIAQKNTPATTAASPLTPSSSDESTIARWLCRPTYFTSVMPRTLFSLPAGTTIGPACGAVPAQAAGMRSTSRYGTHIALHLLHHLVNVPVQHRHRAEALQIGQRLRRIRRAPAPLRIHHPQRNMRKDHDRRRSRKRSQVRLQPAQLIGAELPIASTCWQLLSPMKCTPLWLKLYQPLPCVPLPNRSRYIAPSSVAISCSPGT